MYHLNFPLPILSIFPLIIILALFIVFCAESISSKKLLTTKTLYFFSYLSLFGGFFSIAGSIAIWFVISGVTTYWTWDQAATCECLAYGERCGLFIGIWAPTFFILSHRFHAEAKAKEAKEE